MSARVAAVLFDAAGTLIHLTGSVGSHYRAVALRFGLDLPADALDGAFGAAWKRAPARTSTPGPRPDDDRAWWRARVREVIDRTASPDAARALDFDAYFAALYAHFALPGVWSAFPEAAEVLATLRARGLRLAVVSNFDGRLRTVLRDLGLAGFFSATIISSEVGADKPDARIFEAALAALGVAATAAVHVGDDPRCDGGARAVGLRIFEVRRPGTTLAALVPWLDDPASGEQMRLASRREMS